MPVIKAGKTQLSMDLRSESFLRNYDTIASGSGNYVHNFNSNRRFSRIAKMPNEGVSIITCTHRLAYIDRVFENYLRQEYMHKELIIVLNNDSMPAEEWERRAVLCPDVRVFRLKEGTSLGACYNFAAEQSRYNYLAKFDDDDYYAPQYLIRSMHAFKQFGADIIGKTSRYVYFESISTLAVMAPTLEYTPVPYVVGATLVFKKDMWSRVRFRDITRGEDTEFQNDCLARGYKIFSIDKYNYVTIRHPDTVDHTFVIDDLSYLALGELVAYTDDYKPYIIRNHAYFL